MTRFEEMEAKYMFEELGYEYQESYFENKLIEIRYVKLNKFASCITFKLEHKCFKIHRFDSEYKSAWCEIEFLKAINKQCEELGWLGE